MTTLLKTSDGYTLIQDLTDKTFKIAKKSDNGLTVSVGMPYTADMSLEDILAKLQTVKSAVDASFAAHQKEL